MPIGTDAGLLAYQYRESPRLHAVVGIFADLVQDELVAPLEMTPTLQSIDGAYEAFAAVSQGSNVWLDRIGGRLGSNRPYVRPHTIETFGFVQAASGVARSGTFGEAPFYSDDFHTFYLQPADDYLYRQLLKCRQISLRSDMSLAAYREALACVAPEATVREGDAAYTVYMPPLARWQIEAAERCKALPLYPGITRALRYGAVFELTLAGAPPVAEGPNLGEDAKTPAELVSGVSGDYAALDRARVPAAGQLALRTATVDGARPQARPAGSAYSGWRIRIFYADGTDASVPLVDANIASVGDELTVRNVPDLTARAGERILLAYERDL